jgi:hypothetical protein
MPTQTSLPFLFLEGTSAEISWSFEDSTGTSVQPPAILTATLTLYDVYSDTIINSRDHQDILGPDKSGLNNVDILNSGVATWYSQPGDNLTVGIGSVEKHVALIEWTWDPEDGHGTRQGRFEIPIYVNNLQRAP